jgi:hypothetical protein
VSDAAVIGVALFCPLSLRRMLLEVDAYPKDERRDRCSTAAQNFLTGLEAWIFKGLEALDIVAGVLDEANRGLGRRAMGDEPPDAA